MKENKRRRESEGDNVKEMNGCCKVDMGESSSMICSRWVTKEAKVQGECDQILFKFSGGRGKNEK